MWDRVLATLPVTLGDQRAAAESEPRRIPTKIERGGMAERSSTVVFKTTNWQRFRGFKSLSLRQFAP